MEDLVRRMLEELGEDPDREGLRRTPERVARAMRHLTSGYSQDVDRIFQGATFTEPCDEMVLVKDIEMFSLCEHHMLPFFGRCHVGYIPRDRILGLSKIARVVEAYARRLQVQERLTVQIAQAIWTRLEPVGVGVVIEARHMCMMMRGVEKTGSVASTSAMLGAMRDEPEARAEFLHLVHSPRRE